MDIIAYINDKIKTIVAAVGGTFSAVSGERKSTKRRLSSRVEDDQFVTFEFYDDLRSCLEQEIRADVFSELLLSARKIRPLFAFDYATGPSFQTIVSDAIHRLSIPGKMVIVSPSGLHMLQESELFIPQQHTGRDFMCVGTIDGVPVWVDVYANDRSETIICADGWFTMLGDSMVTALDKQYSEQLSQHIVGFETGMVPYIDPQKIITIEMRACTLGFL